jgi:hypothetical protein
MTVKNNSGSIIVVNLLKRRVYVDCLLTLRTSDLVSYSHMLKELKFHTTFARLICILYYRGQISKISTLTNTVFQYLAAYI